MFRFTHRAPETADFCMSGYKAGRWLYPMGTDPDPDPDPEPLPGPCAGGGTVEWSQEAEAFTTKPVGGSGSDGSASGGAYWNVWANGTISTSLTAATSGVKRVTVVAMGDPAGGVWPQMRISVDGTQVALVTVGTNTWDPYSAALTLTAGSHTLAVELTNDGIVGTDDRNLLVDVARSQPAAQSWTKEAEAFSVKTTGGETASTTASGLKFWNLWSNGYIENAMTVQCTSRHELHVLARGSVAGGIWPTMKVYVGGTLVLTQTVNTTTWTAYRIGRTISSGASTLKIEFTNDGMVGTEDRNLHLDVAHLYS